MEQRIYNRLPLSTLIYAGKYATPDEKSEKRATVTRFMNAAREGDIYLSGHCFQPDSSRFEIVAHRSSSNGLGIRCGRRTVAMSRDNVAAYIKNGATLIDSRRI